MSSGAAMNSALPLLLLPAAAVAATAVPASPAAASLVPRPAVGAATAAQARAYADALLREAAQAEKAGGCEAAYLKYLEAGERVSPLLDKSRAAELQGILTNKLDKLEACYRGCQPDQRQKDLLRTAKSAADSEPRRAAQIVRRLLVGRSVDRCGFWSEARTFLHTLPDLADEMDKGPVDPCEISGALATALKDARDAMKKQRVQLAELNYDRGKLPIKMNDLADLLRNMDATHRLLTELREGLTDCESLHQPLAQDAQTLRESFALARDLMIDTWQSRTAAVTRRIRDAESKLARKGQLLTEQMGEQERLKKSLEALTAIDEELYDDLFALSQAEMVPFSVNVEGRKLDQPLEDVRALMADQKKVMETLAAKYPEYFKDGVNIEGLRRKKGVLEKLEQVMKRYRTRVHSRLGYTRALAELRATIGMMDKAIGSVTDQEPAVAAADFASASRPAWSGAAPWFWCGGAAVAVAGLGFLRMRSAGR